MIEYIIPRIIKYHNIDDLLENNRDSNSSYGGEKLLIDDLLQEDFVCVVGEPGIGKSRLLEEIKNNHPLKSLFFSTASEFELKSIPENVEYCIIDALDEVEGNAFYSTMELIKQFKENNPDIKVLFTCRKHYVASYAKHFASYKDLLYIELFRLRDEDVDEVINEYCSETTKANLAKSSKLKQLLTIPRFLTYLLE